jgi:deoxyribodipyrimidine photolyase
MLEKQIRNVDVKNILRINDHQELADLHLYKDEINVRLLLDNNHLKDHPFLELDTLDAHFLPKFDAYKKESYKNFQKYLIANGIRCEIILDEGGDNTSSSNYLLDETSLSLFKQHMSFSFFRKKTESKALKTTFLNREHDLSCSYGEMKLRDYFSRSSASTYFETRNNMFGEYYATKFSGYLNLGLLHPSEILRSLANFEKINGTNKSTYWIKVELLWREYFYWLWRMHQGEFMLSCGLQGGESELKKLSIHHYLQKMNINPLIKAMNNELMTLGTLSNRARQIYASFLVHKTDLDWRLGAWFFQLYLKDFDFFSNWGNWLYLSGYGTDSRGPRFFNIVKQMKSYDPDLVYLNHFNPVDGDVWEMIRND